MNFSIEPYKHTLEQEWDLFVRSSETPVFLFERKYMEYHSDRFEDASLLLRDSKNRVIAIFPANRKGEIICSHQGLTFGGLITTPNERFSNLVEAFKIILCYYHEKGVEKVIYKAAPSYYKQTINEDEISLLFLVKAILKSVEASKVVLLNQPLQFSKRKIRNIKNAANNGITIKMDQDLSEFWNNILIPNLNERFGTKPVHSLAEIDLLKNRFPNKIQLISAHENNKMIAGILVYKNRLVHHLQYISANTRGKELNALDYMIDDQLSDLQNLKQIRYFSLGTSSDLDNPYGVNQGLLDWKHEFGAHSFVHSTYEIETSVYKNLP